MDTNNQFWLTLGIYGNLPSKEEIERLMEIPIRSFKHKDPTARGKLANGDVASIRLAEWNGDSQSTQVLTDIVPKLQSWMPAFNQLRTRYQSSFTLTLSAFRETDQGGIMFPSNFLQVLVEAQISLDISIQARFLWDV